MAKNSPEGNRRRMAAQRARDRAAGIISITVKAPEAAKSYLHQAARLMREGLEPSTALRRAAKSPEPPGWSSDDPPRRQENVIAMAEQQRLIDQGRRLERANGWRRWLIGRLLG